METPKFKYYRRGTGELDTSNFPEIAKAGCVEVHHLDSRTLISLETLKYYLWYNYSGRPMKVVVDGYVCHMRADKDAFDPSEAYSHLGRFGFTFDVRKVQHDSRNGIQSGKVDWFNIRKDLIKKGSMLEYTKNKRYGGHFYIGADSSVHKFFPEVDVEARKVRENGKVVSLELDLPDVQDTQAMIIVDDILGGGATIQMCVDTIRESGYTGDIFLWTEWNEGIHSEDFLKQFAGYYIGENIYGVN
jgi:hypothetical protein